MAAPDEGDERREAVHQAIFEEEFQGAVHGRWRGAAAVVLTQHAENVVGAERFMALPHQFQHAFAQFGQAQTLARADAFGLGERVMHAMGVIVWA